MIYRLSLESDLIEFLSEFLIKENSKSSNFSDFLIIFPNKKPEYHLNKNLADTLSKPVIPPSTYSIEDLFRFLYRLSNISMINREIFAFEGVVILFDYIKKHNYTEFSDININHFYEWGMDLFQFFEELLSEKTDTKTLRNKINLLFSKTYDKNGIRENIADIFDYYKNTLQGNNLITMGSIYSKADDYKYDIFKKFKNIIFCGFFDPTLSEIKLIQNIYKTINDKLIYIIQEDSNYSHKPLNKIKTILKQEIKNIENQNSKSPDIKLIEGYDTHSQILGLQQYIEPDRETCIVLPEPKAMIPVLYDIIPVLNKKFNISLGYPLFLTPLFKTIVKVLNLQNNKRTISNKTLYFYNNYLEFIQDGLIRFLPVNMDLCLNSFSKEINSFISENDLTYLDMDNFCHEFLAHRLKQKNRSPEETESAKKDFLSRLHDIFIKRFEDLSNWTEIIDNIYEIILFIDKNSQLGEYSLSSDILDNIIKCLLSIRNIKIDISSLGYSEIIALLIKILSSSYIDLTGISSAPVQVLGVLETRCLSFERIYILDFNENSLPKFNQSEPLIPDTLKKALNTIHRQRKNEIYRYYIRRLIKGSKKAYLLYNNSREKQRSRFIEEMIWEQEKIGIKPKQPYSIALKNIPKFPQDIIVQKTDKTLNILESMSYSPTKIDTYLNCPLRFYFEYVLNINQSQNEIGEMSYIDIGTLVHEVLEYAFRLYMNIKKEGSISIDSFVDYISKYFNKIAKKHFTGKEEGSFFLFTIAFEKYLQNFIRKSLDYLETYNIEILFLEQSFTKNLKIGNKDIHISGKIDRIDKFEDYFCIIDYKTGSIINSYFKDMPQNNNINREIIKESYRSLQLHTYMFLFDKFPCDSFYLSFKDFDKDYAGLFHKKIQSFYKNPDKNKLSKSKDILYNIFIPAIKFLISEIIHPKKDFIQDKTNIRYCSYCNYRKFCY